MRGSVTWEKRQRFGTQRTTYLVLLPSGEHGKPVVATIQRAEEVLKSEGHPPERATEFIRWWIAVPTLPHCESRLT